MLAVWFGVTPQTVGNWKNQFPEFFEALKKGKLEHDLNAGDSLVRKMLGGVYVEEKEVVLKHVEYDPAGSGKKLKEWQEVKIVELKKEVPPDTTALIYWLNNRVPEAWRSRQEVTGKDGEPLTPPGFVTVADLVKQADGATAGLEHETT